MLDDLISAYGPRFLVAALGVSLALLCLFIVLWILRNRAPSPFVRGGRNRQPRLQVLDAAAVDTRRRIVLIRRDNVEHLVMIGGPTDIVIESGIGDERPYLSARPLSEQAMADEQALPTPAPQAPLPVSEPVAPMITSPVPTSARPQETAAKPPLPKEMPRPTPVVPQAAAQPSAAPMTEPRRPQPSPVQMQEPAAERSAMMSPMAAVTPVVTAAVPVAATTMAFAGTPDVTPPSQPQAAQMTSAPSPAAPREVAPVQAPPSREQEEPVAAAEIVITAASPQAALRQEEAMSASAPVRQQDTAAGTPPIEAFRVEPVTPVMTEVREAPVVRAAPTSAEPQTAVPDVIDPPAAEDLLEAARQRVLAPAQSSPPARSFEPQRVDPPMDRPAAQAVPFEPAPRDMSDFERVLEEEMALHLAADPAPKPVSPTQQILPDTRADRPRPPVAALLQETSRAANTAQNSGQQPQEPNLQNEIARIFGEMSASRNP